MADTIKFFQYQGCETLQIPAEREAFITLKTWLSDITLELNIVEKLKKQLFIVADEIFTNIATYGYPHKGGTAEVKVYFNITQQCLILEFIDKGIAYNPLETVEPDFSKPLAERPSRGLGVFLVKKLMDSVEYHRDGEYNLLILKKHLRDGVRA